MTERLLQFIWQFQYFNKQSLTVITGEELEILEPGLYNTNQGPDFSNARIRIGDTVWAGAVELHLQTSDWEKHRHEQDLNYRNVILHVVWKDDTCINEIPVLELQSRISKILLDRYRDWMEAGSFIPCGQSIAQVPALTWTGWKERLLAERLTRKAGMIESLLEQNQCHWEETCWWLLARNFGIPVNADAFEQVARSLSLKLISKHMKQIHQLESLLIGQAGLLSGNFTEEYPNLLKREYQFLRGKYGLHPVHQPVHFLRMRPANFPTVRLAQLAMLLHGSIHLFDKIRDTQASRDIRQWFDVTANDYWHYHYRFDEIAEFREKKLGESMIDNILVNTVAPLLFTYGHYHNDSRYKDKALRWLEETSPESNSITRGFGLLGVENKQAFDSQGLIELKREYCEKRRCLECSAGNFLLRT